MMNVLFMSLASFSSIDDHAIYPDLLRYFCKRGYNVWAISPVENGSVQNAELIESANFVLLRIPISPIQKTSFIKKGLSTLTVGNKFKRAIDQYFNGVKFDLVLYPTPPITLCSTVAYIKKRDHAVSFLMLKDIFPQNAIDIEILNKRGIGLFVYWYFRIIEKRLYRLSDKIGCMSKANINYLLRENRYLSEDKVCICPNSLEIADMSVPDEERKQIRLKYGIPLDKRVFIYGGNLGRPQGVDYMIDCFDSVSDDSDCFFLIVGSGTEYLHIEEHYRNNNSASVKVMNGLPKSEYDRMVGACDVGMIFLDNRFSIPNYPSRLLSYLEAKMPVWALTDLNTDIGSDIQNGGFGWWNESKRVEDFTTNLERIMRLEKETIRQMGEIGFNYALQYYSVEKAYYSIDTVLNDKVQAEEERSDG